MTTIDLKNSQVTEIELIYKNPIPYHKQKQLSCSKDVYELLKELWADGSIEHRESFKILLLSRANRLIGYFTVSQGGQSSTVVDPKIIFQVERKILAESVTLKHKENGNAEEPMVLYRMAS